ncbi:hypothetical protein P186_1003 [Pyrobaculum ferrireducens]|uniref:Uncharacterized protein n=1 Tax=Pyrobaculum ferrireducens TaxID=1104324 RepID=G7VBL2_9CREN|nr:hypothetical protein P186_1003 [Pyrobaculum ferrireducens]
MNVKKSFNSFVGSSVMDMAIRVKEVGEFQFFCRFFTG